MTYASTLYCLRNLIPSCPLFRYCHSWRSASVGLWRSILRFVFSPVRLKCSVIAEPVGAAELPHLTSPSKGEGPEFATGVGNTMPVTISPRCQVPLLTKEGSGEVSAAASLA